MYPRSKTWKEHELRGKSRQTEFRGSVLHHWSIMLPKWNLPFPPMFSVAQAKNLVVICLPNPQISNLTVPTIVHSYLDDSHPIVLCYNACFPALGFPYHKLIVLFSSDFFSVVFATLAMVQTPQRVPDEALRLLALFLPFSCTCHFSV